MTAIWNSSEITKIISNYYTKIKHFTSFVIYWVPLSHCLLEQGGPCIKPIRMNEISSQRVKAFKTNQLPSCRLPLEYNVYLFFPILFQFLSISVVVIGIMIYLTAFSFFFQFDFDLSQLVVRVMGLLFICTL